MLPHDPYDLGILAVVTLQSHMPVLAGFWGKTCVLTMLDLDQDRDASPSEKRASKEDKAEKAEDDQAAAAMSQLQRDIQQQLEDEQQKRMDKQRELELLGDLWKWALVALLALRHLGLLDLEGLTRGEFSCKGNPCFKRPTQIPCDPLLKLILACSISCLEPLRLQLERELEAHVAEEQKSLDEQEQAKLEEEEEERKQKESGPAAVFQTLLVFSS